MPYSVEVDLKRTVRADVRRRGKLALRDGISHCSLAPRGLRAWNAKPRRTLERSGRDLGRESVRTGLACRTANRLSVDYLLLDYLTTTHAIRIVIGGE